MHIHTPSLTSLAFVYMHSFTFMLSEHLFVIFFLRQLFLLSPSPTASSSRSILPITHLFDSFKCGLFSLLFDLCLHFWLYNQISFWWIFLDSHLALIWVVVVQQTALSVSHFFLSSHSGLTSSHSARRCGFTLSLLLRQKRTSSSLASASLLTHSALKCSKLVSRRRKSSKARFAASIYTRALAHLAVRIGDN